MLREHRFVRLIVDYNYCLFLPFEFTYFPDRRHCFAFVVENQLFFQYYLHICSLNNFLNLLPFYIIQIII